MSAQPQRMKLVGGPRDGQTWSVPEFAEMIEVLDPVEDTAVSSYGPFTPDATVECRYTIYRVHRLRHRNPDWELWFLAPYDWDIGRAVHHQFSK